MRIFTVLGLAAMAGLTVFSGEAALAAYGQPEEWQLGFQDSASPMMDEITWFHNLLLWIIFPIALFVLGLLLIIMVKFNARANPTPAKFSHNTLLEVVWTGVPILILVGIAIPSFRLLYLIEDIPEADLTIKATGSQWLWTYQYPEQFGEEEFISNMLEENELGVDHFGDPQPRLLATNWDMVVPVGKVVRVQVTAADVIHNWAMPSFGVKMDGVPGRLNETWFRADKEGMFYGQCSELCGQGHAFMPISVRVVSQAKFNAWVSETKQELGIADASDNASDLAVAANSISE